MELINCDHICVENRIGKAKFRVRNRANPERRLTQWQLGCDISDSVEHRRKLAFS